MVTSNFPSDTKSINDMDVPPQKHNSSIRQNGIYLLVGGSGGLGLHFTRFLMENYNAQIAIIGRKDTSEALTNYSSTKGRVEYFQADLLDKHAVIKAIKSVRQTFKKINGVIHMAGVIKDSPMIQKTDEDFDQVIGPKVAGLVHLDEATASDNLDFFVMFSSIVSVFLNPGQSDYAFANRFMDDYLKLREKMRKNGKRNGRTITINWSLWKDGGMHLKSKQLSAIQHQTGSKELELNAALQAFIDALGSDNEQIIIAGGNKQKMLSWLEKQTPKSMDNLSVKPSNISTGRVDMEKFNNYLINDLRKIVAELLRFDLDEIFEDSPIAEFGFDSITFTQFTEYLAKDFNIEISPPEMYEIENLNSLAKMLWQNYGSKLHTYYSSTHKVSTNNKTEIKNIEVDISPNSSEDNMIETEQTAAESKEAFAVIGMSGQFPQASNLEEFWQNLIDNRDCISEVPTNRWDWQEVQQQYDINISKWGGFVDNIDQFDPLFFDISPREAEWMDPQQRILLQCMWHTIEQAGITRKEIKSSRTGVFIGASSNDYATLICQDNAQPAIHKATGLSHAILPNRISYWLDLHGPSEVVDTACSSSLVALHRAMLAISSGECEQAIVGGVNALLSSDLYSSFSQAGMLSPTGRCYSFDSKADGYTRGEGVGVILIKPISKAQQDGNPIIAKIIGSSVNHGGHVSGLTVPSATAQAELLSSAYQRAGLDFSTVSYIEAHGTGTSLGDPIEINGLIKTAEQLSAKVDCSVGTVKANIGHLESAAGIAGIVKVLLTLQHKTIPGNPHLEKANPYLKINGSGFHLAKNTQSWIEQINESNQRIPRRAGISSFGFGGSNAHVIVEEYDDDRQNTTSASLEIFPLSARSSHSLKQLIQQFIDWLEQLPNKPDVLANIAYTLAVGRSHFEYRCCLAAKTLSELKEKMRQLSDQSFTAIEVLRDEKKRLNEQAHSLTDKYNNQSLDSSAYIQNCEQIAQLYTHGAEVDWQKLFAERHGKIITLIPYPFDTESYWYKKRSTSFSKTTKFDLQLNPDNPLVDHHRVGGKRFLPAVASLIFLRNKLVKQTAISFSNLTWQQPIIVSSSKSITFKFTSLSNTASLFEVREGASPSIIGHMQQCEKTPTQHNVINLLEETNNKIYTQDIYHQFRTRGIEYGKAFQKLRWIAPIIGDGVLAAIDDTHKNEHELNQVTLFDCALQALLGFSLNEQRLALPYAAESISLFDDLQSLAYVILRQVNSTNIPVFNIELLDQQGNLLAQVQKLEVRPATLSHVSLEKEAAPSIFKPVWNIVKQDLHQSIPDHVVILGDTSEASLLEKALSTKGANARCVSSIDDIFRNDYAGSKICVLDLRSFNPAPTQLPEAETPVVDLLRIYQQLMTVKTVSLGYIHVSPQVHLALSGMGHSLSLETPRWWCKTLETGSQLLSNVITQIIEEVCTPECCDVALHNQRRVRQFEQITHSNLGRFSLEIGTVCIISGGLGGIGKKLTDWLIAEYQATVIILSRHIDSNDNQNWLQRESRQPHVFHIQTDICDESQVAEAVKQIKASHGDIGAVFHLAGVLDDHMALSTELDSAASTIAVKAMGAKNLDHFTANSPLQAFILFSSAAAVIGNVGQSVYAAANGYMDSFAQQRQQQVINGERHGKTLSINWPLWADGGMYTKNTTVAINTDNGEPLDSFKALQILPNLLKAQTAQVLVLNSTKTLPNILSFDYKPSLNTISTQSNNIVLQTIIEAKVKKVLGSILKIDVKRVSNNRPFHELGVDSNLMVEIITELEKTFKSLPKTLFFEVQNLSELIEYLAANYPDTLESELQDKQHAEPESPSIEPSITQPVKSDEIPSHKTNKTTTPRNPDANSIAIIGLAGQYPGATTLEQFWNNLKDGKDSIREIPASRWNHEKFFNSDRSQRGSIYSKWGGFLDSISEFDPSFFRLSSRDGKLMDPQERLMLMTVWQALESAAYSPQRLQENYQGQVGVFAGVMWNEYQLHGRIDVPPEDRVSLGSSFGSIANRVSYFLGLKGPSLAIDTMCSSSLTALHLACDSLRNGDSRIAIAGGVNLSLHPNKYLQLSQSQFAASDGRCRSFGAGGDGYVPGEGVGVVVLKPLSEALQDRDQIFGVIRGTAINHGGAGSGYTVPRPEAQAEVIRQAWQRAGIPSETATYIEAHGTGTALGDPVEIRGLQLAFPNPPSTREHYPIGSVKSNIGHLESAAGMAALTKVLLQFKHQQLVPSLHAEPENPNIDFDHSLFTVQKELTDWPTPKNNGQPLPRRAAISSFGAGGSNAHLVLEEAPKRTHHKPIINKPQLILLSAKTQKALIARIQDLGEWLSKQTINPEQDAKILEDIAKTLSVGRAHFERRWAFIVNSTQELASALQSCLKGYIPEQAYSSEFIQNTGFSNQEIIEPLSASLNHQQWLDQLDHLAQNFASGAEMAWSVLVSLSDGDVLELPEYCFDLKPLWIDPPKLDTSQAITNKVRTLISEPETPKDTKVIQLNPQMQTSIPPTNPSEITKQEITGKTTIQSNKKASRTDIIKALRKLLAELLHEDTDAIKLDQPFADMGIDSVLAVQIVRAVNDHFDADLNATILYEYSTLNTLAKYLQHKLPEQQLLSTDSKNKDPVTKLMIADVNEVKKTKTRENLRNMLAELLHEEPDSLDENRTFSDFGLDSIHVVEATRKLKDNYQILISATDFYDHSTIAKLAVHIDSQKAATQTKPKTTGATEPYTSKPEELPSINNQPKANIERSKQGKVILPNVEHVQNNRSSKNPRHLVKLKPLNAQNIQNTKHTDTPSTPHKTVKLTTKTTSQLPNNENEVKCMAAVVNNVGVEDEVEFITHSIPLPPEDHVQIAVKSSSISLSDIMRFRGLYPEMPDYPFVAGVEVSGVITSLGDGVNEFNIGDPVIALMSKQFGGHSTYVNAHRYSIVRKPEHLNFDQACTLPSSFLTAYYGLYELGRIQAGETVLIHTAASALGVMAIQLVHAAGGIVIATTGTDEKCQFLNEYGIKHVINYQTEDFFKQVMTITNGRGVDIVLNNLKGEMIQKGIDCLAAGGRYLESALGAMKTVGPLNLSGLIENKSVMAIGLRTFLWKNPLKTRELLHRMMQMLKSNKIQPLPYTVFGADKLRDAIQFIKDRKSTGKVLLHPTVGQAPKIQKDNIKQIQTTPDSGKVAIIGISGRFPGADSVDQLWQLLNTGQCSVGNTPKERIQLGGITQSWGGFLTDIEYFDPLFFNIAPMEAEWMEPQHRLLMEEAWKALEDAGIPPSSLAGSRTGVFVGGRSATYAVNHPRTDEQEKLYGFTGSLPSIMAGRIAFTLDLKGPATVIDTACSSGLVALNSAINSMAIGESDMSIVAGVSIGTAPDMSPGSTRYCRAFDDSADGFVVGEGIGVLILKPYTKAIQDNDQIYGIIRGSGINQDGRSNGLLAPNGSSQSALLDDVWRKSSIDPTQIGMIEAHGTGTKLGDPLEFTALTRAMRQHTEEKQFCAVGSIKTNIGHLLAAAGISGLIKTLLCLKHKTLVPSLHFDTPNEHIDFINSPYFVPTKTQHWPLPKRNEKRLAAVSAFGFSGTNAHVVIEEAPKHSTIKKENNRLPHLFLVTAHHPTVLTARLHQLLKWIEQSPSKISLDDLAYTLACRRQHHRYRVAVLAESVNDLIKLLAKAEQNTSGTKLLDSDTLLQLSNNLQLEQAHDQRSTMLLKLAGHFIKGGSFDWHSIYTDVNHLCISLPAYPFQRTRYWLDDPTNKQTAETIKTIEEPTKEPVLQEQQQPIKSFEAIRLGTVQSTGDNAHYFDFSLSADAFYLHDHQLNKKHVLPGVMYLEIVIQAMQTLWPKEVPFRLENVIWVKPIIVHKHKLPVRLHLTQKQDYISYRFCCLNNDHEEELHSQGKVYKKVTNNLQSIINIDELRQHFDHNHSGTECYHLINETGIYHGTSLQTIERIFCGKTECMAELKVPDEAAHSLNHFTLHPSLLDGALQSLVGFVFDREIDETHMPFSISSVQIKQPMEQKCIAWLRGRHGKGSDILYDISLLNRQGSVLVEINGFLHKRIRTNKREPRLHPNIKTLAYRPVWEPVDKWQPIVTNTPECTVLFTDSESVQLLSAALSTNDTRIIIVTPTEEYQQKSDQLVYLNPDREEHISRFLSDYHIDFTHTAFITYLTQVKTSWDSTAIQLLTTIKAIVKEKLSHTLRWTLLINAPSHHPICTGLMALTRTIRQEITLLDIRTICSAENLLSLEKKQIQEALQGQHPFIELDFDGAPSNRKALYRSLHPAETLDYSAKSFSFTKGKTVVITGGTGGLGQLIAKDLSNNTPINIALLAQRTPDQETIDALINKAASGSDIHFFATNVTDRQALKNTLTEVRSTFGDIHAIIHCAGLLRDSLIRQFNITEFKSVSTVKYQATQYLDELTAEDPIELFCTFSSIGALIGNVGQSAYVFGSALMDALIIERQKQVKQGLRCGRSLTINWPLWASGGMRVDDETEQYLRKTVGLYPLTSKEGLQKWYELINLKEAQYGVICAEQKFLTQLENISSDTINFNLPVKDFVAPKHKPTLSYSGMTASLEQNTDASDKRSKLFIHIIEIIAQAVKVDTETVEEALELKDLGIDSVILTKLCNEINETFSLSIAPADLFALTTLDELVDLLLELKTNTDDEFDEAESSPQLISSPVTEAEDIRSTLFKQAVTLIADVIKLDTDTVELAVELQELGFDSVMLTKLCNSINETFALSLAPADLFSLTSIDELVDLLESHKAMVFNKNDQIVDKQVNDSQTSCTVSHNDEPSPNYSSQIPEKLNLPIYTNNVPDLLSEQAIAIIGMDGRYPNAQNLQDFWQNLTKGKDCVTPIPKNRWYADEFTKKFSNEKYCPWGGFIEGVDEFDPMFFGIAPRDAEYLDPQERLFLQSAWSSFENAGYGPKRIREVLNSEVGIFVGVMWGEYQLYSDIENEHFLSASFSSIANRVSFSLNLSGPSIAVDTMCSSSLTAIHLACQSLRSGECHAAIAGGVNLSLHPNKYARLARNHFSASDGRCRAFGEGGDGYVPGEGIGSVLLKPLSLAIEDGDYIHGVIRSSSVNHGGKTNSYTVPNAAAQEKVITHALSSANIDPSSISYIEAHGTGTSLGDPIEINGLSRAFEKLSNTERKTPCAIGSVKSNIGHLEAAAGIAGLHKVLLQMRYGQLVQTLHAERLNPEIDFSKTPFVVQQQSAPWISNGPRIAGVSSFGAGGSNSHILVEEYLNTVSPKISKKLYLITLSAKSEDTLRKIASNLSNIVQREQPALPDIETTLLYGRESLKYRIAFVCSTYDELIAYLDKITNSQSDSAILSALAVRSRSKKPTLLKLPLNSNNTELEKLANKWINGAEWNIPPRADWSGRIIPLPTYPFTPETYWFQKQKEQGSWYSSSPKINLDKATSDTTIQTENNSPSIVINPDDPLLHHHIIGSKKLLPGAAIVELARTHASSFYNKVSNVIWLTPLALNEQDNLVFTIHYSQKDGEKHNRMCEFKLLSLDQKTCFAKGKLSSSDNNETNANYDISSLIDKCHKQINKEQFYLSLGKRKFNYGPLYQVIQSLWINPGYVVAHLKLNTRIRSHHNQFIFHPALLDGAFQSVSGLAIPEQEGKKTLFMPFQVRGVSLFKEVPDEIWVYVTKAGSPNNDIHQFNIEVFSNNFELCARIEKLFLKSIPQNVAQANSKAADKLNSNQNSMPNAKSFLQQFFMEKLKLPKESLTDDLLLEDCGLDSVTLVELMDSIQRQFDFEPDVAELGSCETLGDLAYEVTQKIPTKIDTQLEEIKKTDSLSGHDSSVIETQSIKDETDASKLEKPVNSSANNVQHKHQAPHKIAIIGLSCRFPNSIDENEYWQHLVNGDDLISEVPASRWDWRDTFDTEKGKQGKTYSRWAGFAPQMGALDPGFFKIPEESVMSMDPQHIFMLEMAQHLFDNAGYTAEELSGTDTAVILGAAGKTEMPPTENYSEDAPVVVSSGIQNMIAARISDYYNLHGHAATMDTACSSSLVAVHDACRLISTGECQMAIAGGVTMFSGPKSLIGFSNAKVLSDDGKCYAFDKRAKGIVLGEGAGMVLLKDYESALKDGDNIRAVISGSAVNNDGRTMGLTTPSPEMQEKVILSALERSGVHPESINYLEAHGTGTLLGDPIEIKAATNAYRKFTDKKQFCHVGSVKSNIGHLLLSAGIASLIKVVKMLENRVIPPTLHCESPHPRFNFPQTPFKPINQLTPWKSREGYLRAGISAFGFGGTNCHVILEEAPTDLHTRTISRSPLPATKFNRKQYWFSAESNKISKSVGEEIEHSSLVSLASNNKDTELTADKQSTKSLFNILCALKKGEMTVAQAMAANKELEKSLSINEPTLISTEQGQTFYAEQ